MSVISEGIQFPEQVAELRKACCSLGQGYHFAAPMDAHDMQRALGIDQLQRRLVTHRTDTAGRVGVTDRRRVANPALAGFK